MILNLLLDGRCRLCERHRRLRDKYAATKGSQRKETELLEKDIQQLGVENEQLERKFNAIQNANEHQFEAVCLMTEEKLQLLFKQVPRILPRIMPRILENHQNLQLTSTLKTP